MTKRKGRRKRNELAQVNEERTIVCMKKMFFSQKPNGNYKEKRKRKHQKPTKLY